MKGLPRGGSKAAVVCADVERCRWPSEMPPQERRQQGTEATSGGRREIHLRYLVDGSIQLN